MTLKDQAVKGKSNVVRRTAASVRLRGEAVPSVGAGLVIVRTDPLRQAARKSATTDQARVVVAKAGRALNSPGFNKKKVVFGGVADRKVFAYSILPSDPTKVIRESADGKRSIGRLVNGKFKAA